MHDLPLVLTVEETARYLRISRGSAYEAVKTNEIPHVRIGRRVLIPRAALLALLGEAPAAKGAGQEQQTAGIPAERSDQCGGDRERV